LKIVKDALVRNSRCAGHKELSFDEFVTVIVIRAGVEVCDRQERLNSACHL